ncbi:hypothetical protein KQX54_006222 [Cotesia glomerata]|uniref:Uncharacterized protein n=1 Tax=Cotesia glomerata TaxID=32391 RepID=A0AAV7IBJ7_COTGL|nr:hypothetical protein KQX54_006222 [Cotesia glomerata]
MKIIITLFAFIAILESIQALTCNNYIDFKKSSNTICSNGTCICKPNYIEKNGVCKVIIAERCLNNTCVHTYGCRAIANSVCSDSDHKCVCSPIHTEVAGKCLGLLGAACSNDAKCDSFYRSVDKVCKYPENVSVEDEHKYLDSIYSKLTNYFVPLRFD